MGYFISIRPALETRDLMAQYGLPVRAEHARCRCEHRGADGNPCPNYTTLRPDADGKRRCFFHHADTAAMAGADPAFDDIMRRIARIEDQHEAECSIYYYRDNYQYIKEHRDRLDTLIEVGCYLGGLSAILARTARQFGLLHYIIEYNLRYLLYTHERIARVAPEALGNVRFYHGTFPEFVKEYATPLSERRIYLSLDGSHTYDGVVADLRASHAVRRGIHSIACHDFHLRSADPKQDLFVDRAIFSIFGAGAVLRYAGFNTGDWVGDPNTDHSGNNLYNKPNCFEGAIINLAENGYCFDQLPFRPALRRLARSSARLGVDWVSNKFRQTRRTKDLTPVYEPRERTGLELLFPIEAGKWAPEGVEIPAGQASDVAIAKRAFWQYDGGKAFVEIGDPAAVRCFVADESIARLEGLRAEGLSAGQTRARVECGGFKREFTIRVAANEAAPARAEGTKGSWELMEASAAPKRIFKKDLYPEGEFFLEMAKIPSPRILEIGSRKIINSMPRQLAGPNAQFVGLDIIDGNNVDVVGDAHRLSDLFEANSFDGVYSAAVFEHLAMPWRAALEINRILRPGGLAYVASHHTYPVHEMPWDFWRYGKESMGCIFNPNTGFEARNEGLIWSGHLCRHNTKNVLKDGDHCFLFTQMLARKIADYNPARFHWDLDCEEALPRGHVYPKGTGFSWDDPKGERAPAPDPAFQNPVGSAEELFARFLKGLKRWKRPRVLVLSRSGDETRYAVKESSDAEVTRQAYRGADDARAVYHLAERTGGGTFDAIVVVDVLGLLEFPWAAAVALAKALRPGGVLFVKDTQARPMLGEPDLWRFSSEALRVLFNRRIGLDVQASILADPCTLHPDSPSDPLLTYYDPKHPCYLSAACLAIKRKDVDDRGLAWDVGGKG